LLPVFGRHHR
jgi:hypothetical protein